MLDFLTTTIGLLISPLILIPCCFVGTSGVSLLKALMLGSVTGIFGALFSYPLYHFFFVSNPLSSSNGEHVFLTVIVSGFLAGAIVSGLMRLASRRGKPNDSGY